MEENKNTYIIQIGKSRGSSVGSAEVKNAWSYTSTPQYFFMAWYLVKHRDNFTFIFFYLCYSDASRSNLKAELIIITK
jgi:hypothetical protein